MNKATAVDSPATRSFLVRLAILRYGLIVSVFWAVAALVAAWLRVGGLSWLLVPLVMIWLWLAGFAVLMQIAWIVDALAIGLMRRTVIVPALLEWTVRFMERHSEPKSEQLITPSARVGLPHGRRSERGRRLGDWLGNTSPLKPLGHWAFILVMRSPVGYEAEIRKFVPRGLRAMCRAGYISEADFDRLDLFGTMMAELRTGDPVIELRRYRRLASFAETRRFKDLALAVAS